MAIINRSIIHLTGCQPRTLASLMELQDSSFRRLLRLAPQLRLMRGTFISRVVGALDLHLSVVEKFKYTTTILLTYQFAGGPGALLEPNVTIRLYHDARLAEVISDARRHRSRTTHHCQRRGGSPTELERKWEQNRFLQKWLGYCLRQGHLFLSHNLSSLEPADIAL